MRTLDAQFVDRAQIILLSARGDDEHVAVEECTFPEPLAAAEEEYSAFSPLRHGTGAVIVIIEHEEIVLRMMGEDFLLAGLIDLDGAVAHDMVRRHVQYSRDMRIEALGGLELIAGYLGHRAALAAYAQDLVTERRADVAAHADLIIQGLHQEPEQRHGRGLAIRARHSVDWSLRKAPGHLDLAHDLDAALQSFLHERDAHRHHRRKQHDIHARQQRSLLLSEDDLDAEGTKLLQIEFNILFGLGIAQND